MRQKRETGRAFASDNWARVHPEVLAAMAAANVGHVPSYGTDPFTHDAEERIRAALGEILYVGVFSSGLAFALQIIGQRYTTAPQAAIFLSAEALFGASLGALLLGETMGPLGYAGCALMFAAMLAVELVPEFARRRRSPA